MLPLFVALQVTPPAPPPGYVPAPPGASQPAPGPQVPYPPPYPYPPQQPSPYPAPQPYPPQPYPAPPPYPYPYAPQPYAPYPYPYPVAPPTYAPPVAPTPPVVPAPPPAQTQPAIPATPPPPPEPERTVTTWFVRAQLGLGPQSFSEQSDLLRQEGFGGPKFWLEADGGYFVHPNVALGLFAGLNLLRSSPTGSHVTYRESCYFVGAEAPLRLGDRSISLQLAPRIGVAGGEESFGGDGASFRGAFAYGALLSATTFKYHFSGSIGYLRALAGAPTGTIGRSLDFGGLEVLVGGVIDG